MYYGLTKNGIEKLRQKILETFEKYQIDNTSINIFLTDRDIIKLRQYFDVRREFLGYVRFGKKED